jgi:hypothetical protein
MKKERLILKSDNLLVNEYATHFWMGASERSEHMNKMFIPMNVGRILTKMFIRMNVGSI